MYLDFYGLRERPFNATPDPRFLYMTPSHREALSQLVYGVTEQKGFLVLTGEVGTGKTTLLQALLRRLDGGCAVAYVFNSTLAFDEIVEYALADYGVPAAGQTRAQRLFALNHFLIERCREGRTTVLIIDEAQNLDVPTLEQVRLLSNFESPTDKLLQILLVGQPELKQKLERPDLRQLRQRIGLRACIEPLTPAETADYIRTRLRIAGADDPGIFGERAIARIAQYAAGIPRVVNLVCDHCLLIGYADETRHIDAAITERAIAYLEGGASRRRRRGDFLDERRHALGRWTMGLTAGVLLAATALTAAAALGGPRLTAAASVVANHVQTLAGSARVLLMDVRR